MDIQVYMSSMIYDPEMDKHFHLYVAASSVEEAASIAGTNQCQWLCVKDNDKAIDFIHVSKYCTAALTQPGVPMCDLEHEPYVYRPWGIDKLVCSFGVALFEIAEHGEQKVCMWKGCGKPLDDTVRMSWKTEENIIYMCADCAKDIVKGAIKERYQSYLDAVSFETALMHKMFHEDIAKNNRAST